MSDNAAQAQVPDQRLDQIMEEMRRMRDENKQLRGTIDYMSQQQQRAQQPQTQPQESDFQPHIDKALEKKFKQLLDPVLKQQEQAHNYFADRDDFLMFSQKYGLKNYESYKDKIETLRAERARMGQPLTREDAYRFVAFEENAKKPQPNPEPAQVEAQFDPYLGKMVVPQKVAATQQVQTPQVQQQAAPPQRQVQPQNDNVDLPPVGSTPPPTRGGLSPLPKIELGADEKALEAWAETYGDQPV